MEWIVLVCSGLFEAVWASALAAPGGLRRPVNLLVFSVAMLVSITGLAYAMTQLSAGTAYAVWVGVGAAATIAVGVWRGAERLTWARAALLSVLVGSVIGLKLVGA